ncbi:unknown [Diachasmimorpha longicaudata entomopoxvirus]|uniref:Uncharacterized protein n=1 Tax=Diachasmimorpha longicaudata entomopoxvirus TaxID=109981 RepID=Q8B5Y3_9POXV|nr:hypothetical protein FLA14_p205 [Diachasmimorpha longicaudata entomopoxvirus]AAN88022.1 unknown [Diachasmimorpha longicaudata entomopoxvirus]
MVCIKIVLFVESKAMCKLFKDGISMPVPRLFSVPIIIYLSSDFNLSRNSCILISSFCKIGNTGAKLAFLSISVYISISSINFTTRSSFGGSSVYSANSYCIIRKIV